MEVKKTTKADLTKKSNLFFSIGLIVALSLMLMSFEWTSPQEGTFVIDDGPTYDEELIDVPVTDSPPPVPVIKQPKFEIVPEAEIIDDNKIIDIDKEFGNETDETEIPVSVGEPDGETDVPFKFVEESAMPVGGIQAFYKYVSSNIKYPAQARRMGIEGKVFVEFVINKDGTLTDVKPIKGIGGGCDEEAVRIIQAAPAWNPGKQRGKPVRQRYTVPIYFKLN
jgi:protein TonB